MASSKMPDGYEDFLKFPLFSALTGRRSRRFFRGAEIPDGPFKFASRHAPLPLSELEKMLLLTAVAGATGWNYLIMHNARYAPHLPNYAGAAGGRTFPSSAGFHTAEVFFTDDDGVYLLETRDAPAVAEKAEGDDIGLHALLEAHRKRIRKLSDGRLHLPPADPHIEGHNHWVANRPGSLLVIPVADVAQHNILNLCYYLQNGYCIYNDVHNEKIEGLSRFNHMREPENLLPLSFVERYSLLEATTEIATACYAGTLALQAIGLGGWMFNGMNPFSVLGASGDPAVPGLGFRYDQNEQWPVPNPTGLEGVFEGYCPPHYPDMRSAVDAVVRRKFGPGGPYHPQTRGPWRESGKVRASAQAHSEEFKQCVTVQSDYILSRFGKFPGTVPSILAFMYLQAHHLDLEFYDRFFEAGAYLRTHADHMRNWHLEAGE